jgi:hypothetical protein
MPKRGRPKAPKGPKLKAVNYRIIPPLDNGVAPEPYRLLEEIRDSHHAETLKARVALAWRLREKPDKDGHVVLGRCIKVSDLNKEFADWDFIITLNRTAWDDLEFTKAMKMALLDHEMMHAQPSCDSESGEQIMDERNRPCWRTRKHDCEEFFDIVRRHGVWKRDLEIFAETLLKKKQPELFVAPAKGKSGPKELSEYHAQVQ